MISNIGMNSLACEATFRLNILGDQRICLHFSPTQSAMPSVLALSLMSPEMRTTGGSPGADGASSDVFSIDMLIRQSS